MPSVADNGSHSHLWRPGRVTDVSGLVRRIPVTGVEVAVVVIVGAYLARPWLGSVTGSPVVQTWSTVFVSIAFQALPFLVLGTLLSGAIAAYVRPGAFDRLLPRSPAAAVPVAGLSGVLLPGCECGSVPIAGRLVDQGVAPSAALTFLLAAPAINPVVVVATLVAFPGMPEMAAARFGASLATSILVGWIWLRAGRDDLIRLGRPAAPSTGPRGAVFRATVVHDFLHAGGYLMLGAAVAATVKVVVPASIVDALGGAGIIAVLAMALLAVLVSICSEADAFVAASFSQFSNTAKLAFLVVGPAVDLKLVALQGGTFGRSFTMRFAPLAFVTALVAALAVGSVVLP